MVPGLEPLIATVGVVTFEATESMPLLLERAERELLTRVQLPVDITHIFAPGIYMRQAVMPAGSFIMGHKHRTEHLNLLMKGKLNLVNQDGTMTLAEAPFMCMGTPGRKAAFVLEEATWINVHATNERDVEKLDAQLLDMSEHWKEWSARRNPRVEDIEDYWRVLSNIGMSADEVRRYSETDDLIPFPLGSYKVKTGPSDIEGKGLYATARIAEGEFICMARIDGRRTPAGRYINHGKHPNVRMERVGHDLCVVAVRAIGGTLGGAEGEELTVDYRQALEANRSTA